MQEAKTCPHSNRSKKPVARSVSQGSVLSENSGPFAPRPPPANGQLLSDSSQRRRRLQWEASSYTNLQHVQHPVETSEEEQCQATRGPHFEGNAVVSALPVLYRFELLLHGRTKQSREA